VLLGGQPLPILYSSANQINAQVPYDLPVNTQHQVVVRRGSSLSVPEAFTVASAQPGIFTANQQGTGQGIVIGPDQISVADPNKPAQRGQVIIIYCTGLGAVRPASNLGEPAPSNPLAMTVNPVQVTAGEKEAQVFFSGLTPGFTGLYQVNAILAADTPAGDAVPLTISSGGQTSNVVTIAVR
jgi:adhesin/invasin